MPENPVRKERYAVKKVYVNEQWCLGCHLCEYYCAFANSGQEDMVAALKDQPIFPRIQIEEGDGVNFAVNCRHCDDPLCVKSCITGALQIHDGRVVQKCELCLQNTCGEPACVKGCPNRAIVYEER